jgi:hypothetical protein
MEEFTIDYSLSDKNSKFYKPTKGSGDINVINNMAWTISPISSRKDVPFIELTEYQQTTGQLIASLVYYGRVFTRIGTNGTKALYEPDDPSQVYQYKYFAEPTGFTYILPYFNPKKLARTNTFGSEESPFAGLLDIGNQALSYGKGGVFSIFSQIAQAGGAAKTIAGAMLPGAINFENPQSWTGTGIETIEVTFDLFNTGTWKDIENNRRFCHLFSYQNTPSRRNFAIVDPPVIYSLNIPDVVQFPACYVSSLNITNLGNNRIISVDGGDRVVPEAYRIAINFTSLLMPTRNIMRSLEENKKVQAISDVATAQKAAELYAQNFQEGFQNKENLVKLRNALRDLDKEAGNKEGTTEKFFVNTFRIPPK